MNKLKLITTVEPDTNNPESVQVEEGCIFIPTAETAKIIEYSGELPVLMYREGTEYHVLNQVGSPISGLVKCSDLKEVLDKYLYKGTKYIVSIYDPTLYYLFPGVQENDELFTSENSFIPTLPISSLIRDEVDGFDKNSTVRGSDIRCMKACDSWFDDLSKYEEINKDINIRISEIFRSYESFDVKKEVRDKTGRYSASLIDYPIVVSLISGTVYTDTINLEDWALKSKKGTSPISGKLDISYMYSIGDKIYSGMQTIKAFQFEENLTTKNVIIDLGNVQLEYMNYVLKIYPLIDSVEEAIITDCTLTIGTLYE